MMYVIDSNGLDNLLKNLKDYLEKRYIPKEIMAGAVETIWNGIEADTRIKPTISVPAISTIYTGYPISNDVIHGIGVAVVNGESIEVSGRFEFEENQEITYVADSGNKIVLFIPDDNETFSPTAVAVNVSIDRADLEGEVKFVIPDRTDPLRLKDIQFAFPEYWPECILNWVGCEDGEDTEVEVNHSYVYSIIPTDRDNYNNKYGTFVPTEISNE